MTQFRKILNTNYFKCNTLIENDYEIKSCLKESTRK